MCYVGLLLALLCIVRSSASKHAFGHSADHPLSIPPPHSQVCVLFGMLILLRIAVYYALKVKTTFKQKKSQSE